MEMLTIDLTRADARMLHTFLVEHCADLTRMIESVDGVPLDTARKRARLLADRVEQPLLPTSNLGEPLLRPVVLVMAEGLSVVVGSSFKESKTTIAYYLARATDCKLSEAENHVDTVIAQCAAIKERLEKEGLE